MFRIALYISVLFSHTAYANQLISGCKIYDTHGIQIRSYPGNYCEFFDSGFLLQAGSELILFNEEMNQIWKKPLHFHHQINRSRSGLAILGLSSEVLSQGAKKIRSDSLYVLDIGGNLIQKIVPFAAKTHYSLFNWDTIPKGVGFENSHINTFREIPPNFSPIPAFQAGNYLFMDTFSRQLFILDHSLTKIIWSFPLAAIKIDLAHDAQVLSSGNILLFENHHICPDGPCSRIVEFDPSTRKVRWSFGAPLFHFFHPTNAGVEQLDNGNLLFTDVYNDRARLTEINRDGTLVRSLDLTSQQGSSIEQVRLRDLSAFLKNNTGF
jgi:hypothetical protein